MVNESGTHMCYTYNEKYLNIRVNTWKNGSRVEIKVSVGTGRGKNKDVKSLDFSRLALECFSLLGRILLPKETVDHNGNDRANSNKANLRVRFKLFGIASVLDLITINIY
jgi:hypothetical protein